MKTKKPKKVKVNWITETWAQTKSEYQCPSCHTVFINTLSQLPPPKGGGLNGDNKIKKATK